MRSHSCPTRRSSDLPLSAGESCASGGYFTVIANPKQVMWTPQGNSNSWHRDANWTMIDAFGNIDYSGGGYVPGVKTDVLIPNHADMPVLQKSSTIDSQTALVLADDSQEYIEWDINFVANSCGNIHVAAHAQFGNQQWLTYDNAWVDVPIATGKWNLFAPPFLDLVTGDMHIPASGVYKNPLFGPVDNADNRGIYRFFTSFFNSESYTTDRYGEHTSVTASTWTAPFNALSQKIVSGHGYSIWPSRTNGADSVIVRLPKSEERYYYYGSYGEQTSLYEDIKRPTGGHKLAGSNGEPVYADFDLRHEDISSHLVANPFLSDLDIDAFMDDPYNLSTVSQHFSLFVGESRNQVVYNRALKIATEGEYVDKIAPMSSFLVHINPAATRPQLRVDPSMLQCNKKSSRMRAPSANHYPQLRLTAVRNGVRSTCLVVQVPESDATYHSAEDSKLTMLSGEMTPAAIYTHDHSVGMAINVLHR